MAIKTVSNVGTFCIVVLLIVALAAVRGDTERVVTLWQRPVASVLHRMMSRASLQHVLMTIEMACDGGTFARRRRYFA